MSEKISEVMQDLIGLRDLFKFYNDDPNCTTFAWSGVAAALQEVIDKHAAPRPEPARTCGTCNDLLDYLYSTTEQACATESGVWDSGGIANYADAMLKLEQHGLLLITTKRGRRVIAQPKPRPSVGQVTP